MNGYVTPTRLQRIIDIPVSFPQTELRRGKFVQIAQIPVDLGQQLQVRELVLHVIKNLTLGQVPTFANTSLGIVSVGLYFGSSLTSPLALACTNSLGAASTNPYKPAIIVSPGVYTVTISNNTTNMDFAVSATGTAKLYL